MEKSDKELIKHQSDKLMMGWDEIEIKKSGLWNFEKILPKEDYEKIKQYGIERGLTPRNVIDLILRRFIDDL
jgi:hypothetical protein